MELEPLDAARERRAAGTKVAPVAWAVRAGVDTQGWTRDLGAAVRRAHRCVARRVARSHSSQPAVLQTPGIDHPRKRARQ